MMQIFNASVRLGGSLDTEVQRRGLTVPEIYILRRIHGEDAVVKLEHVGFADIDPVDERERLDYEYATGLAALHEDQKTSVEKLFGGDFAPLPEELRDFDTDLEPIESGKDCNVQLLAKWQEPVPYASPNHEDKGAAIRRKAAENRSKKAALPKAIPTASEVRKNEKKSGLDAVL